jgi:serine/threonine protein kinase
MSAGGGKPVDPPGGKPPAGKAPAREDLLSSRDIFGELVDAPLPPSDSARPRTTPVRIQVSDPVLPSAFPAFTEDVEEPGPTPADFAALFQPAPPVTSDEEARVPAARQNTHAKLVITDPRVPSGPRLDLASVAESGMETATPTPSAGAAPGTAPGTRPSGATVPAAGTIAAPPPEPRREPFWRDDTFGPYKLLDRVAVGGMAEVFKAKRAGVEGFEKIVAVKRILPHLSDNKEFLDMFVDEAKMVAGLTHPNIVHIFDLGKIERSYFIAMEYVHGRDLRTIQKRAREKGLRMPLDLSLRVVSQVCAALEYAHRKKDDRGRPMEIVHRDVSPQNILISFEGEVKLVDFGIAKAATKASSTDRGALRGKVLYMSPEQAWGRPIDRRSDVFSLGIVLYELVTDTKPFLAAGTEVTILELVRQCVVTPPREINGRVPEALDRVIMKALAREPDDRYEDAGQMQRGLERILRERPPVTARDLARFLELLFDRSEREEAEAADRAETVPEPGPMPLDSLLRRFGIDEKER